MLCRLSRLALAASILSLSSTAAALSASDIPSDTPIQALLNQAQHYLSQGAVPDALVYYDAAIARDPDDYLTYFKRATTYLSLGRLSQAASDFQRCLELRPGFEGAHLQLGKLKARNADWAGAKEQYLQANAGGTSSSELEELLEAQGAAKLAEAAAEGNNWDECIDQASVAIKVASRAVSLRELRSRCRFAKGEIAGGIGDLHHVLNLRPGDTSPHIKISATNFYAMDDLEQGMAQVRKCLHSDPDSKVCRNLLKEEKAVNKTLAKVEKALEREQPVTATRLLTPSGEDLGLIKEVTEQIARLRQDGFIPEHAPSHLITRLVGLACQGYYEANNKKAKEYCTESLAMDESSFYGLLHRAREQQESEEYEAAVRTLEKAGEVRPDKKQAVVDKLLREAQTELRRSKNKDYYKVLGVARDADERQIKSAYRKLTVQYHPDKAHKNHVTKEEAEKKMAQINEAYEVLSDPELRARFDRGDDPNSQERQHPYAQGGNPFGGGMPFMFQQGGQQFQFKFGGGGSPFG
ncbi:DnaJ-domain-containing protein [Cryphonectria parasitica EP155]|uniref:Tetratricopeptide repeat and J domain-containing co-chaperone DNJ1 n=1 Tax=Cryphonectria parasitica (strain ATCC 38755 / EP155) TaxID=660469 RepID=A0A9P4Y078_CRYP1|nr:DnaJ-domain-containing protein [Cryphonectria parasitica EP155]KAF3763740.1 DnaJ-domain-containing protein [Cryphonectria parasitica EP155]